MIIIFMQLRTITFIFSGKTDNCAEQLAAVSLPRPSPEATMMEAVAAGPVAIAVSVSGGFRGAFFRPFLQFFSTIAAESKLLLLLLLLSCNCSKLLEQATAAAAELLQFPWHFYSFIVF